MDINYSGKFLQKQCKIQLSKGNLLGERKVLESDLFRLSKSLKSNIFTAIVPPPKYTGFITNLPFGATRSLECTLPCSLFLTCLPFFITPNLPTLRYFLSSGALDAQISCCEVGIQFRLTVTFRVIHAIAMGIYTVIVLNPNWEE